MKAIKEEKVFRKGHIYFSQTREGRIRTFKVSGIAVGKDTGKRLYVIADYDGKPEQRYDIKVSRNGGEYVMVDQRFCTVIDTTELIDDVVITDSMISNTREFNNCGQCIVTLNGERFLASWDHGKVTADSRIADAFRTYIYG